MSDPDFIDCKGCKEPLWNMADRRDQVCPRCGTDRDGAQLPVPVRARCFCGKPGIFKEQSGPALVWRCFDCEARHTRKRDRERGLVDGYAAAEHRRQESKKPEPGLWERLRSRLNFRRLLSGAPDPKKLRADQERAEAE
jgi:hypothetical protein